MQQLKTRTTGQLRLLAIVGLLIMLYSAGCSAADEPAAQPPAQAGSFAVIELFTSEGCSSCPPADDLLGEIVSDAHRSGENIFPIAFHIDYWDGLGWRDRFSLADATQRQQRYANALNAQVYTPQMIVNGQSVFVGSDKDACQRATAAALAAPASAHLTIEIAKTAAAEVTVAYSISDAPAGSVLNLVVVQRSASTEVPRGENAGHTLHHVNIARSIKSIPIANATGQATLILPTDLNVKDSLIIGYVQNAESMKILAAARIDPVASGK